MGFEDLEKDVIEAVNICKWHHDDLNKYAKNKKITSKIFILYCFISVNILIYYQLETV